MLIGHALDDPERLRRIASNLDAANLAVMQRLAARPPQGDLFEIEGDITVQVLPSPPLVPTSMSEGGEIHDNSLAMAAPGSTPVSAPSADIIPPETLPLPVMPPQAPVNPQAGRYGSAGLQHAGARSPEGDSDSAQWPGGNQGGGNQGGGNPGAGDSGDGALWQATPSFGPPRWGPQASNS